MEDENAQRHRENVTGIPGEQPNTLSQPGTANQEQTPDKVFGKEPDNAAYSGTENFGSNNGMSKTTSIDSGHTVRTNGQNMYY